MTDHAHLLNGSAKAHADELLRQLTEGITAWAETPRDGCRVVEVIAEVHRDEEYEVPRYILRVRPRLEIPAGGSVWSVVFDVDLQVVAQVELLAPLKAGEVVIAYGWTMAEDLVKLGKR